MALANNKKGFTLIEVIIALAILSIALFSIIISSSEIIRNIDYLRKKTIAIWVAGNVITEARIGEISLPLTLKPVYGKTKMLNSNWQWRLSFTKLSGEQYQIRVDVGNDDEYNLAQIISFVRSP